MENNNASSEEDLYSQGTKVSAYVSTVRLIVITKQQWLHVSAYSWRKRKQLIKNMVRRIKNELMFVKSAENRCHTCPKCPWHLLCACAVVLHIFLTVSRNSWWFFMWSFFRCRIKLVVQLLQHLHSQLQSMGWNMSNMWWISCINIGPDMDIGTILSHF